MTEHPGYNLRWVKRFNVVDYHVLQELVVVYDDGDPSLLEFQERIGKWKWVDVPVVAEEE